MKNIFRLLFGRTDAQLHTDTRRLSQMFRIAILSSSRYDDDMKCNWQLTWKQRGGTGPDMKQWGAIAYKYCIGACLGLCSGPLILHRELFSIASWAFELHLESGTFELNELPTLSKPSHKLDYFLCMPINNTLDILDCWCTNSKIVK